MKKWIIWLFSTNHKDIGTLYLIFSAGVGFTGTRFSGNDKFFGIIFLKETLIGIATRLKKIYELIKSPSGIMLFSVSLISILTITRAECTGKNPAFGAPIYSVFKKGSFEEIKKGVTVTGMSNTDVPVDPNINTINMTTIQNTDNIKKEEPSDISNNNSTIQKFSSQVKKYVITEKGSFPEAARTHHTVTETTCLRAWANKCDNLFQCKAHCPTTAYAHPSSSKKTEEMANIEGSTYNIISVFMDPKLKQHSDKTQSIVTWAGDGLDVTDEVHINKEGIIREVSPIFLKEAGQHGPMTKYYKKKANDTNDEIN